MGKTLDRKINISRDDAKKFLKEIASDYRTLSDFEKWAANYEGPFKNYLLEVVEYLIKQSRKEHRIYRLGDSEIEEILNATFPLCL